ncbi:MAG: transposase [Cyanobacteria bacterium P01_C01_bin.121]
MSASEQLYDGLESWLTQSYRWRDQRHLQVLIYMVRALLYSGSVNLSKWSTYLPNRGQYAQSQQRRVSRWLKNPNIVVSQLYSPIIKASLSDWQQRTMYLSLDSSMLWNEYCLIRLVVVHRGRGLTLAWRVMKHASSTVTYADYKALLMQAVDRVPREVAVVVLADRGFVQTELMTAVDQLGWGYRIRIKSGSWLKRYGHGWSQVKDFHLAAGEALMLHTVRLHKGACFGPVHVAIACHPNGERWAVVSNQKTTLKAFQEYGWRFNIEESFLDDKSNGFELERSQIRDAKMLERLCFVLAIATLYLTAQGLAVVESGNRQQVDIHWLRGNSYLRIGWDWIRRAAIVPRELINQVRFLGSFEHDPVIPSLTYLKQRILLEFTIQTLAYPG